MKPNSMDTMVDPPWIKPVVYEVPATSWGSGDKVVCIDAKGLRRPYVPGPPVEGHLYCVREVYVDNGQTGILLVGIRGPLLSSKLKCGFLASRFRWVHD